jgi:hypothetical protein
MFMKKSFTLFAAPHEPVTLLLPNAA